MHRLTGFLTRLQRSARRRQFERDMAIEMRAHIELETERRIALGEDPATARRRARAEFGSVDARTEEVRANRLGATADHLLRDLRLALRTLAKAPGFTLVAITTLALGIGASTAIFSLVQALLISPLHYRDAGDLVQLQSRHPEQGVSGLAPATFSDIAAHHASFATLAAQYYYYVNLTGTDSPALLNSADVTADYFKLFDVAPLKGRTWNPDDFKSDATPVVVLSHALWLSQFHARDSILGQPIMLDDVAYTVIGIMPPSFKEPAETAQLWRPMRAGADDLHNRSSRYWTVFGRRQPGVSLIQANAELATLAEQLVQAYPANYAGWALHAADLRSVVVGDYRTGLLVLLGAVGCVMLITCANVTGLSILRATARRRELAIRTALGSTRGQLVRLLLAESLMLAIIGCGGGVLLAHWWMPALLASMPEGWLPRADEIAINLPVLATSIGLALLTGGAAGLVPGFATSQLNANDALKDCARGSAAPSARRLRAGLIVVEIALAMVLLTSAGLLGRSFLGLLNLKPGLDADRVLSLTVSLSGQRYDRSARCWDFFSRAETEVAAVPGVEAAGFTHTSPFRWGIPVGFSPLGADDAAVAAELPQAFTDSVSVDYFKALGIPLRRGRLFTAADNQNTSSVVVVSETAARRYFGAEDPIGRFITPGGSARFEVVGVVGDVRRTGLTQDTPLQVYRPLAQRPPAFATLMVRTSLPPATLAKSVQAALWRVDPDTPVTDIATMDTFVSRSVSQPRLYLVIFSLFAALALLLATVGIYGLISYSVTQRTREMGIRLALGAAARDVITLVLKDGLHVIALGLGLGTLGAGCASQLLQSQLYHIGALDPMTFVGVAALLLLVGAAACCLPARRAARTDPMIALRAD